MKLNSRRAAFVAILLAAVACGYFRGGYSAVAADPQKRDEYYLADWNWHLKQFTVGQDFKEVQKELSGRCRMIGFWPLGGSGARDWIFSPDDFYEIVVSVDGQGKVTSRPYIQEKRRWLRHWDGSIRTKE